MSCGRVVPGPAPVEPEPVQLQRALEPELLPDEVEARPASRHPWAWLRQRVFAADIVTGVQPTDGRQFDHLAFGVADDPNGISLEACSAGAG